MRKWLISMLMIIFAVCLITTGCTQKRVSWDTYQVARGSLVITVSTEEGHLNIQHDVRDREYISFNTPGEVAEIFVRKGDRVTEGQLLARLDTGYLERNVAMAQVRYEAARIDYEIAEHQLMQTIYPMYTGAFISDLPGTWLALEEVEAQLDGLRWFIEQLKVEDAQAQLELVGEGIAKAKMKLHSRRWPMPLAVKVMELQTDKARAALDLADLELTNAKQDLEESTIVAPFDGVVADVYIYTGQQLSAVSYTGPSFYLVDPSKMEMTGDINEMDISMVQLGQEAVVTIDALPEMELRGKVTHISTIGEVWEDEVLYEVTIALENPGEELKDGMSATARITIDFREDTLLIPDRAVQGAPDNFWVEVVVDGKAERKDISLGFSDGILTEVLSGLEEGEEVLLPTG